MAGMSRGRTGGRSFRRCADRFDTLRKRRPEAEHVRFELWTGEILDMKEASSAVCADAKMAAFIVLFSPKPLWRGRWATMANRYSI